MKLYPRKVCNAGNDAIISERHNSCVFSFVPLRPFFYAAPAKRWKVQFRQWFAYFNNVDSKRHIIIRTAILYNEISSGQIMKNTK